MNTFSKLMAAGAIFLGLGGCATAPMSDIAAQSKDGSGVMFAVTDGASGYAVTSAKTICDLFPGIKDDRCDHPDQYVGVRASTHGSAFAGASMIAILAPKDAGIGTNDIIKIKVDGNRPAYFLMLAAKGKMIGYGKRGTEDCYNDTHVGGSFNIVCPKYNWDSSRDVNQ